MVLRLDASPWGVGAALHVNDRCIAGFASELTDLEAELMGHAIGDPAGQHTWEALAHFVVVRGWRATIFSDAIRSVVNDRMATLSWLLQVKARGRGPAMIVREQSHERHPMVRWSM